AAGVVGRARLAGAPGLGPAQVGEQLRLPPHGGEAAGIADVAGQEAVVDGERAGVHVAHRVDQADHPARAAQVEAGQRVPGRGQVFHRPQRGSVGTRAAHRVVDLGGGAVQGDLHVNVVAARQLAGPVGDDLDPVGGELHPDVVGGGVVDQFPEVGPDGRL